MYIYAVPTVSVIYELSLHMDDSTNTFYLTIFFFLSFGNIFFVLLVVMPIIL